MSYFVKGPGTVTHHNGTNVVVYQPGEEVLGLSDEDAKSLLARGAVQTQPLENGRSDLLVPDEAEIAQAVAATEGEGQPTDVQ